MAKTVTKTKGKVEDKYATWKPAKNKYTGRCMKCKEDRQIKDAIVGKTSNGVPAVTGQCPKCSTRIFKFRSSKKAA